MGEEPLTDPRPHDFVHSARRDEPLIDSRPTCDVKLGVVIDSECPTCGHRAGAHTTSRHCDVCAIIRSILDGSVRQVVDGGERSEEGADSDQSFLGGDAAIVESGDQ